MTLEQFHSNPSNAAPRSIKGVADQGQKTEVALATHEVCSGAVLPGGGCPEPQATGAVPQPTDNPTLESYQLAELRRKNSAAL
jgi:hypothetical protein